jgi:hypothetical protein
VGRRANKTLCVGARAHYLLQDKRGSLLKEIQESDAKREGKGRARIDSRIRRG